MMKLSIILLLAQVAIQVYDAWSTITIIKRGGREKNPRVAWLIDRIGLVSAVIGLKAACVVMLTAMVWAWGYSWLVPVALTVVSVYYIWVFRRSNFKHDGI
jgi:Domain of unknown function (DUF5658)